MGHQTKWEYLRAIYERYRKAGRRSKQVITERILSEHGLQPKIRDLSSERPSPGKATHPAAATARAERQVKSWDEADKQKKAMQQKQATETSQQPQQQPESTPPAAEPDAPMPTESFITD